MRILYLHQYFCTPEGSSGTRSYEFSRRLVANGHHVDMITSSVNLPDEWKRPVGFYDLKFEDIYFHVCNINYSNNMNFYQRLKSFVGFAHAASRIAKSLPRPDIVFASSTPLTIGIPGIHAAKYHKCPMVFEVRDCWPEIPIALGWLRNPILRILAYWLQRRIYRFADHIVALSPDMKNVIVESGVSASKVSVIPNCSDIDLFKPSSCDFEFRHQMGWPKDAIVAIHPGAMGQVNGLGAILDAAVRLRDLAPRVICVLIGDGKERSALEARKAAEGIDNVIIQGAIPKKQMPRLTAAADIGLMTVLPIPELYANSANKFFDYLAAGLPIVMNYGGWKAELLRESGAGLASPPGENDAFATLIAEFANNKERRKRASQAARKLAVSSFDRNLLAKHFEEILQQVVNGHSSAL